MDTRENRIQSIEQFWKARVFGLGSIDCPAPVRKTSAGYTGVNNDLGLNDEAGLSLVKLLGNFPLLLSDDVTAPVAAAAESFLALLSSLMRERGGKDSGHPMALMETFQLFEAPLPQWASNFTAVMLDWQQCSARHVTVRLSKWKMPEKLQHFLIKE